MCFITKPPDRLQANGSKENDPEETTEQSEAFQTEQVTDEFCTNSEYEGNDKPLVEDDNETKTFEFDCWDKVFEIESNDQQY